MLPPEEPYLSWIKFIAFIVLATIGGIMGYIMRTLDADKKINWKRAIIEGIAAGFVGLLFYLLCQAMSMNGWWAGVIVGVAGWLGANVSIRILEKAIFKKLGVSPDTETDDVDTPQ